MRLFKLSAVVAATVVIATGCAAPMVEDDSARLQSELDAARAEAEQLKGSVNTKDQTIGSLEEKLAMAGQPDLLPPNAKPGECYARVFTPPQYESVSKQVLHQEEKKVVTVAQPTYGWGEERVLVREASKKLEVIPARYEWVEEQVMVREASERLEVVPAVYEADKNRVLVRDAYKTWKKGRGPIEKVDHMTGEIMCLVEVPAEYKTVTTHREVRPAQTRRIPVPAKYQTVRKRVLVEAPKTVEVDVPAEYRTVRVKKQATPGSEDVRVIPATYQTVTDRVQVAEGKLEWRPILCETNTTPAVVMDLQRALNRAGYAVGPVDGVFGARTRAAMVRYQKDNGLASGQPTLKTLRRLGVMQSV